MRDYLAHEDRRKELEEGVEAKGKGPLKTRKGHVETSAPLGIKQPPSAAVRTNRAQGFSHPVFSLHRLMSPVAAVKICEIYNLKAQRSRAKTHKCFFFLSICWKQAMRCLTGVSIRLNGWNYVKVCVTWPVWDSACELQHHAWLSRQKTTKLILLFSEGEELYMQTGNVCRCQHIPASKLSLYFPGCWTSTFFFLAWTWEQKKKKRERRSGWQFRQKAVLLNHLFGWINMLAGTFTATTVELLQQFWAASNQQLHFSFLIASKSANQDAVSWTTTCARTFFG